MRLILDGLDVSHVEHPQVAAVHGVSLTHLVCHEGGRRSTEPKEVLRHSPIGEVVIHARAAAALLLLGVGQLADVAEVVVHPHQRHILGQVKAETV